MTGTLRPIGPNECIERVAEHFASAASHHLDLGNANVHFGLVRQTQRRLSDVDSVIANPLEIVRHFDGANDETKIARHWLLQRQQLHGCLFDFHFEAVQFDVAIDHELCLFAVAVHQGFDGKVGALLGLRRHTKQRFLQRRKLIVKMTESGAGRVSCHPNLPVIYASVLSS